MKKGTMKMFSITVKFTKSVFKRKRFVSIRPLFSAVQPDSTRIMF